MHAASEWDTVLVHWYRLINAPLEEEPPLHAPRNEPCLRSSISSLTGGNVRLKMYVTQPTARSRSGSESLFIPSPAILFRFYAACPIDWCQFGKLFGGSDLASSLHLGRIRLRSASSCRVILLPTFRWSARLARIHGTGRYWLRPETACLVWEHVPQSMDFG